MLRAALVKIHGPSGVVGNGFLGSKSRIVTCAHVVAAALDVQASALRDRPTGAVVVEFHWTPGKPRMPTRVLEGGWHPGTESGDIAILALEDDPPAQSEPLHLALQVREQFPATLHPFIPKAGTSTPIEGRMIGADDFGRNIFVANDQFAQFIEPGVSGAAVFAQHGEVVEGIIVQRDAAVRQALVCPASAIKAVFAGLDAAAQGTGAPPKPTPEGSPNTAERKEVNEDDFAAFLGIDPLRGEAVLSHLAAKGPKILKVLLKRAGGSQQVRIRLQKLCQKIGPGAIPLLLDAIRAGSWSEKLRAAPCFAVFRGNSAATDGLTTLLQVKDFDVQRLAVEAVGHIGYSGIAAELVNLAKYDSYDWDPERFRSRPINNYSFGKLNSYVLEALTRFFVQAGKDFYLEGFYDLVLEQSGGYEGRNSIKAAFDEITPAGGDVLIKT